MKNGSADMALADLTINSERMDSVDFSVPFMQNGIVMIMQEIINTVMNLFVTLNYFILFLPAHLKS